ncbi:toll/interleukin-1 receptor domain-containing protein [Vibrio ruber]|uniref:toll/interleukin-1 receptor domain-containing protein n=1 Tax=Vibrio ruber TaxID=184755 RepID=UPI00289350F1|nr:toll/interleukin-1 receptor domain-containing protein [Vibrio ruber]WNJ95571.1 toll/interleukin-1 receptor domain-containing protein [Vibrio ruber]
MKVFISWSGERSRAVADLLDDWIQCVLQAATPWMSSKDIDRGSLWFSEITDQLKDTKIGIVCLTKANREKPWILFESGALAKGLSSSRVCTFLIDLESTDVSNPLAQFNHTTPDKDGVYELIRTLNSALGDQALREKVLERVFDTYWPQFEIKFDQIIGEHDDEDQVPERSEESILTEVLRTVRGMDRRIRNLEKPQSSIFESERLLNKKSSIELERRVYMMLKDGVPPEVVEEINTNEYPASLVSRAIRRARIAIESENDDSEDGS